MSPSPIPDFPEPDVAIGTIPNVGIAAAVSDDGPPILGETLNQHGFTYHLVGDVYLLPSETDHHTAVRAVAAATRQLQEAGWSVAADPRVAIPDTPASSESDAPIRGETLKEMAAGLSDLEDPSDVAELVTRPSDEHVGVLPQLHRCLDAAADWCEQYDDLESLDLAQHLRNLAGDVGTLSVRLTDAALRVQDLPGPPPARTRTSAPDRAEHAARSQAATASSPHCATGPTKPSTPEAAPPVTGQLGQRHHR